MNVLQLPTHPTLFTHHEAPHYNPIPSMMSQRKRKAEDEDENMGSPNGSPAPSHRSIARPAKKSRGNIVSGHPLTLPRLLETLDAQSLRSVLQSICERHPEIGSEVVASAPRPSVPATLGVLSQYQERLREAFPFGGNAQSDYAFNRVKQALEKLIEALTSFTPHYLPPNETQATTSFTYLDSATQVVHDLPNWDSHANNHFKYTAYEDITKAWTLIIQEASKRGGGFQVKTGGWDQRLKEHNVQSGGRMQGAVNALASLGWMSGNQGMDDPSSIRNQLLSGTYGTGQSVGVGSW